MGKIIAGTYEIDQEIGSGGNGIVYLGRHLRLQKLIVLKADKRKLTTDAAKLRREVDLLKGLNQTYIPQVYDFVEDDGTVYTVMDYIEGESLDKVIERGKKPAQKDVIKWACELLEALSYLHSRPPHGILHGDIKPANIMLRPDGTICLIDYNIALALGEDGAVSVGFSRGYASPESYGLVYMSTRRAAAFASNSRTQSTVPILEADQREIERGQRSAGPVAETTELADLSTEVADDRTEMASRPVGSSTSTPGYSSSIPSSAASGIKGKRVIRLDVRSDIYSLGATLYHLISGRHPVMLQPGNRVVPLTSADCAQAVADIINKAMAPAAEDRYQSADEMLEAFREIRKNDPRALRLKRQKRIGCVASIVLFLVGGASTFTGMQQMQQRQEALTLSEYSANALSDGDIDGAIADALAALPSGSLFDAAPTAQAQYALTSALGVYDLADHYRAGGVVELPSEPFHMAMSPNGTKFAAVTGYEVTVYDLSTGNQLLSMPAVHSALADVVFADDDTILFAGERGITCASISKNEVLWTGAEATGLSVSMDGTKAAAVNRDDTKALLYDVKNGTVLSAIDFDGRKQKVAENDTLEDPDDDVFVLNHDGSFLAVSFDDGALILFNMKDPEKNLILYDSNENTFNHFEAGFNGKYFSYVAYDGANNSGSEYGTIDVANQEAVAGYQSNNAMHLKADETGTYLVEGGLLNKVDFDSQSTQELANVQNGSIRAFDTAGSYALVSTEDGRIELYERTKMQDSVTRDMPADFVLLSGRYALTADKNSPKARLMAFQSKEKAEILSYDPSIEHDEARTSKDQLTAMLFDINGFTILSMQDGSVVNETKLPDSDSIYDQQFRRSDEGSYLEVFWYDGTVRQYSASDGHMILEKQEEAKNRDLEETFDVNGYHIKSRLHEAPEVLDQSGQHVTNLESDGALTYVSGFRDMILTEYVAEDFSRYGYLLNRDFEKIAYLPDLCDTAEDGFVFDEGGSLRFQKYMDLNALKALGDTEQ